MKFYSLFFVIFLCVANSVESQEKKHYEPIDTKRIHNTIFDLYFPGGSHLSTTEEIQRQQWRETLWQMLHNNPHAVALLNLLQPNSSLLSDELKNTFSDIIEFGAENVDKSRIRQLQYSLRRNPDNTIRMFSTKIRNLYSYLVYSSPLSLKIAGYDMQQSQVDLAQEPCILPATQLVLKDGVVSHVQGEIDYLIVGSGPAGSLIAHELLEKQPHLKVVLIDAGPFVMPHYVPTESSSELMESGNMRSNMSGDIIVRNARAFGGGTIVNLDLAFSPLLPQIQTQVQSWIDAGYIDRSLIHASGTNDWKWLEKAYRYIEKKIGTRTVGLDEVNKNNKILLDGINTATCYDLNSRKLKESKGKNTKISALDVFVLPALQKGLSIIPEVKVRTIVHDQNHATGVEIEFQPPLNKLYTLTDINNFHAQPADVARIYAKNIIICSGTLGSAEILLRSQIPNNNIGKGIVMHPSMGVYGRFYQEINTLNGLSASVYAPAQNPKDGYFFESMSADPSFLALINPGSGSQIVDLIRDTKYLGGFGIMLIDSVSDSNKVFINQHTNQVEIDYTLSEKDKQRFRKGIVQALHILFEQGAYQAFVPSSEPLLSDKDEYLPFACKEDVVEAINRLQFTQNQNFISSAHMQGSNKIGSDPQQAVVSGNFKVWNQRTGKEFDNLYVCDSSIFPTSIGANPMQSIYTFAKLFVDKHLATLKNKSKENKPHYCKECGCYTKEKKYDVADTIVSTFLTVGGVYLANKQLPLLAGEVVKWNNPVFTKVVASTLFAIGLTGGVVGVQRLAKQLREKLNDR